MSFAEDVAREHAAKQTMGGQQRGEAQRAAERISALLALAEAEAKAGNEPARAAALEKAAALQFKYSVDAAMAAKHTTDEVISRVFCRERKAPLVRARRELVAVCAMFFDGTPIQLGTEAMQVFAHESVMDQIEVLYTSLLLQVNRMMAQDEKTAVVTPGWRLAYARTWVGRVNSRLQDLKNRETRESGAVGTAVVLRDRKADTLAKLEETYPRTRKASSYSKSNSNHAGRNAGWQAGGRADLGQQKVAIKDIKEIS